MSEQQEYEIRHNKGKCQRAINRERLRFKLIRAAQFRRAGHNQKESAYLAGVYLGTYQLHQHDFDNLTDKELDEEEEKHLLRISELTKIKQNIGKKRTKKAKSDKIARMKFSEGRNADRKNRCEYHVFSDEQFMKLCTYYQANPEIEKYNVWFFVNALRDYRLLIKKLRNLYTGKLIHSGLEMKDVCDRLHAMAALYPYLNTIQPDKVSAVRSELLTKHPFNITLAGLYRYQHSFDDVSDAELDDEIQKTLSEMNLVNTEPVKGAKM